MFQNRQTKHSFREDAGGQAESPISPQREVSSAVSGLGMDDTSASAGYSPPHMERKMSAMACTVFNELRLEGKLCDVIIKVNGFEFNAHKNILCSCSPYFRALFTSGWNNMEKRVYNIPGISPDMMKLIIEYAYTRTVPVTADNVESLLAAADQFNIMGIIRGCCEFLKSQLCLENCIGICRFTDYYHCPDLRQTAYMFILHNFEEMTKVSTEFLELSVNELNDIIEKDELNVRQEDAVFEAIVKWISHDPQNRKQYISDLLRKVRLALMHAEYFMNNVKVHDYVKDSEECKPVIINALKAMYDLNMNGPSNSDFTNPLTRPRLPYAILFAIGGWSGGSPTNAIETYDARADKWVNVTCQQESPRAYHGAAYLKGYVYIIGGFDSVDYFNSVKRFDPLKKTWHQVAPMHSRRCYVSVTVLNNFIYAMGGFDGYVRLNTAERYEPETNQWTLIAPMHEQRSDASATTLYEKVYICGGFNGNECLFTAEVYDAKTNQWTLIAPMRSRRSGIGVIAYGEHVYAVGGFDGANRLRSAEAYNPVANTWRTIPTMFNPRSNFGIEVVDDLLFVVGGFNGFTTTFNVECYDEKTDEWYDAHDMSIYRSALSCCVVPGLSNVGEYAARRDDYVESSQRDEVKYTSSTSTLPV
ncbi:kelch-like protein 10 isoform X1 [Apteryx rowi]|uniref:kelch-like protein 10 isoform X1 n=2 Tax=Apteryx rowi TaxID=308060 RepID=UPI0006B0C8F2|nr:PREDICTED: kelch-like protein 10 [Apteryx mantelli mantelli]XP_025926963.1 kelch-like protein 10 isoform X1 [Apteryx rowi]